MIEPSIERRLDEQEKELQAIAKDVHVIKRRLLISAIGSYLRLAILLIPLILAIIYLPPILREFWQRYGDIVGAVGTVTGPVGVSSDALLEAAGRLDPEQLNAILRSLRP